MGREIKFRCFDSYSGKMLFDGDEVFRKTKVYPINVGHNAISYVEKKRFGKDGGICPCKEGYTDWEIRVLFSDESLFFLQFTGLKDKNGVEIYEGDIVKYYAEGWNCGGIGDWTKQAVEFVGLGWNVSDNPEYEVIGNIYKNSELLEK